MGCPYGVAHSWYALSLAALGSKGVLGKEELGNPGFSHRRQGPKRG